ncbi:MAG: hypothetical protein FJ009_14995 [Chloroflexi bacterium]|nr:hypothetical protein [Chloroflexota bacterium]
MQHHIAVDQSIKVEQTNQSTVLAFSDGIQKTIVIPAEVKRDCQRTLRARGVKSRMIALRIFAAGLLVLLESQMRELASITIDTEYEGREGEIRSLVLRFVSRQAPNLSRRAIVFRQIGRQSAAHTLAWETHRGKRNPDHVVTLKELLRYC